MSRNRSVGMEAAHESVLGLTKPSPETFGLTENAVASIKQKESNIEEETSSRKASFESKKQIVYLLILITAIVWGATSFGKDGIVGGLILVGIPLIYINSGVNAIFKKHIENLRSSQISTLEKTDDFRRYTLYTRSIHDYEMKVAQLEYETKRKTWDFWSSLDGHQFEAELAKLFLKHGYDVRNIGGAGDEGIDLVLSNGDQTILIQSKSYSTDITPHHVRDFYGAWHHWREKYSAQEAWFITTNGFTGAAKSFVQGKPLRLYTIADILKSLEDIDLFQLQQERRTAINKARYEKNPARTVFIRDRYWDKYSR